MAASIPLTLAMTFGIIHVLNIDIQQVSIATLIIALGLLVDMPVVAGDAIKRELALRFPARSSVLAWADQDWPRRLYLRPSPTSSRTCRS